MRIARLIIVGVAVSVLSSLAIAAACPFCSAPSLTLTEQLSQSDAAVLAQWVSGKKPTEKTAGSTTYEVVQIVKLPPGALGTNLAKSAKGLVDAVGGLKGPGKAVSKKDPQRSEKSKAAKGLLKKGNRITLTRFRAGKKGDLFMLMGSKATTIEWGSPLEVSETSFNYIAQAPSPEAAAAKRLNYFVKFLEFPDSLVSNDAYAEFANAPYNDIVSVAEKLPRERIRKWIADPETPQTRFGLYGLLLGLCGKAEDSKLMETMIAKPTQDFRLGIDGIMSGYLLLTGDKGLDVIDRTKLKNIHLVDAEGKFILDGKGNKQTVPFSETYAAMQALRFMWTYGDGRIKKERLRQSMRILLDRPELSDLVIADLARWKDWSVQDRLMKVYGTEEYSIPSIKRAIIRYMLVSTKDKPDGEGVKDPVHVVKGRKHLKTLREKDPKTVREAERFFFLQ